MLKLIIILAFPFLILLRPVIISVIVYFFYLNKMHVNQPESGSPVYTIVFPLSLVDKVDKRFGSLGLILPDYKHYNEEDVLESCRGENANLTDPMFGYTE